MTRKTTAHGRKLKRMNCSATEAANMRALQSPVGVASTKSKIDECRKQTGAFLTRISTRAYLTQDGERDIELLATLAILLGMGAEIGITTNEHAPETRKMHAALRTVLQMSVDGGHWIYAQAPVLHDAAKLAAAAFDKHPEIGLQRFSDAEELGNKIRVGTARMSDVFGVEVYSKQQHKEKA